MMILIAAVFIFAILVFVWPLNAILQYARLHIQKKSKYNIENAFQMFASAVAGLSIINKAYGNCLDGRRLNTQFTLLAKIILCNNDTLRWKKPNWALIQLATWLTPFEKYSFVHFFIKTITIPNGNDCRASLVFQLALNIGQLSGLGYFCIYIHQSNYFEVVSDICENQANLFRWIIVYIWESNGFISDLEFKILHLAILYVLNNDVNFNARFKKLRAIMYLLKNTHNVNRLEIIKNLNTLDDFTNFINKYFY
jgi:hypothetical protein